MKEVKKICKKCKEEKTLSEFRKGKKYLSGFTCYCKKCANENSRLWYLNNKEWYLNNKAKRHTYQKIWHLANPEYSKTWAQNNSKKILAYLSKSRQKLPENYKARCTLNKEIRTGKIKKRNICEICYASPTQCHHDDYTKPLEFIELCVKCHLAVHGKQERIIK